MLLLPERQHDSPADVRYGFVRPGELLVPDLRGAHPELVIVAAAGNLSDDHPGRGLFWPAAVPGVVSVGAVATPSSTDWASWSNRGPWVDLAAPADRLASDCASMPRARAASLSGSSSPGGRPATTCMPVVILAWARNMVPNLPAPTTPTVTGRP